MAAIIQPDGIYDFFLNNYRQMTDEQLLVAEDKRSGIEVYMTEDIGFPCFVVELDGNVEYVEGSRYKDDTEAIYRKILLLFIDIDSESPPLKKESEPKEEEFLDGYDSERVDEIFEAAETFLNALLEYSPEFIGIDTEEIETFLSIVEEVIYQSYGVAIRHPIIEDGKVINYPVAGEED